MSLRRATVVVTIGLLAMSACDRTKKHDCNNAARTLCSLGAAPSKEPKKADDVPAIEKPIRDALAAWEQTKSGITTGEVKSGGDAYAATLRARLKLLDHAFDPPPSAASAPAPMPSDDTPEGRRKAALTAAAGAAFGQMFAGRPTNIEALATNSEESEKLRLSLLFDICHNDVDL